MKQFRFTLLLILIGELWVLNCDRGLFREKLPESDTIRNVHVTPTIIGNEIHWKVYIDWIKKEKGTIRISEESGKEIVLESREISTMYVGNPVSKDSILYKNPNTPDPVVWIVEWKPDFGRPENLRYSRILSGEMKTSVHRFLKNR